MFASEKQPERAARLLGAARALGYPVGGAGGPIDDRLERDYFAPARARYGPARGAMLSRLASDIQDDDALAYALTKSLEEASAELRPPD